MHKCKEFLSALKLSKSNYYHLDSFQSQGLCYSFSFLQTLYIGFLFIQIEFKGVFKEFKEFKE